MAIEEYFERDYWRSPQALARLLFEQKQIKSTATQIASVLEKSCLMDSSEDAKNDDPGWEKLLLLRQSLPMLSPSHKRHPIVWVRFGFSLQRNGIVLSDNFLHAYANWRNLRSGRKTSRWVHCTSNKNTAGSNLTSDDYLLDYFIHSPCIDVDIFSDIEVTIAEGPQKPFSMSEQVGSRALVLITEYVVSAAVRGSIKGLQREKDEKNRYICHLTRAKLADALRSKYPAIAQFKQSIIIRALSALTACSWPRMS